MKYTYLFLPLLILGCSLDGSPLPGTVEKPISRDVLGFLDGGAEDAGMLEPDAGEPLSEPDTSLAGGAAPEPAQDAMPEPPEPPATADDGGTAAEDSSAPADAAELPLDAEKPILGLGPCEPCETSEQCAGTHLCLWPGNEDMPRCFPRKDPGDPTCSDWGDELSTFELENGTRFCAPRSGTCERWLFAH